jgi:hypothetical protein
MAQQQVHPLLTYLWAVSRGLGRAIAMETDDIPETTKQPTKTTAGQAQIYQQDHVTESKFDDAEYDDVGYIHHQTTRPRGQKEVDDVQAHHPR